MCGSLRREQLDKQAGRYPIPSGLNAGWGGLGDRFLVRDGKQVFEAKFDGHARSETLSNWLSHGWKEASLLVSDYTEGHGAARKEYSVPAGKKIKCIILQTSDKQNTRVFKVVTRDAVGNEMQVHNRFPVVW